MATTVTYQNVLHQVALRMNALVGSQAATLETTYATATLTSTNFKSADFPFSSFKDSILMAEEKLAHQIANTGKHPLRIYLTSNSAAISSGQLFPIADSTGFPVIGIHGAIYDASDSIACTERTLDEVRRANRTDANRLITPYWYAADGNRLFTTRANVKVEVCVYKRSNQATSFDANSAILLSDALEEAYVCGAISYMTRDSVYEQQAAVYRAYFNDTLAMIAKGLTVVPETTQEAAA